MCPMLDKIKFERMRGTTPLLPPRSWETDIIGIEPGLESGMVFGFVMYLAWPIEVVHLGFKHIIHHRTHTYFRATCSVYGVF